MKTHVTTIYANGWECDCDSPYRPAPGTWMGDSAAEIEGRNHAEYYDRNGSPHEVYLPGGCRKW
jgi:hypothetical protein